MTGSTTKKLTAQTLTSAATVNGNGLGISMRCDDNARQPNESAIPSATASVIWTVTPNAAEAEGTSALIPAAVVTPRANVAGLAPVAPAYRITHAISATPPATPAMTPWRIVSSTAVILLSAISSKAFGNLPPYEPSMVLSSCIAAGRNSIAD